MRRIKINGLLSECVLLDGWSIAEKINAPSTFNCTILNVSYSGDSISVDLKNGYEIELVDGNTKLFGGVLKAPAASAYNGSIIQYSLSATDYTEIAYRRLIAASIVSKTAGDIVRDHILPILANEGISAGDIVDANQISKANFNYISCGDALNYLRDVTGCNWWIDYDKNLHFVPNTMIMSPWELSSQVQHSGFSHTLEHDQYRNVQYLKGGQGQSAMQVNEVLTPEPDGDIREFKTRFPVAQITSLGVKVGGVWQTVSMSDIGVNGLDDHGTKKWFYTYGSRAITQDSSETVLSAGQGVRMSYVGLINIFVLANNPSEINSRAAIEGTSGRYEKLDVEPSIDEADQATEYAQSLINKFGEINDKISFSTEVSGLRAGQLLMVNKPEFGLNGQQFLIESVSVTPTGPSQITYAVSAIDGVSLGGWETYFAGLVKANQTSAINSDETVILLQDLQDNNNISATTQITTYRCLWPDDTLYPSSTLRPNSYDTRSVILYD